MSNDNINKRVLIVEDEALIAHQLKKRILNLGYGVTDIVSNSEDALTSLRSNPADIVLMDIVIKGATDGIVVADMVQQEFNIPVIFLTAYTDDETLQRAELTRAYGYLVKPVQVQELNAMIRIVLTRHQRDLELLSTIGSIKELGHALDTAATRLSMGVKGKSFQSADEELRHALENKHFLLQYQPQVCIKTGEILGAEALIRWNHPSRGVINPSLFIPDLEKTGLIHEVGEWVIETAAAQVKSWLDISSRPLVMAINISSTQILPKKLDKIIDQVISSNNIPPDSIELEVTETIIMDNNPTEISVLRSLKEIGVKLSIDDFGTGYSGLSYLQNFPFDVIKIDREFVRNISKNNRFVAIIKAILNLAQSLDMQTIAEGVEKDTELEFLKQHHCDIVQGFLFSPPVDADEFTSMLKSQKNFFQ